MIAKRGLLLLSIPFMAALGVVIVASSMRHSEELPAPLPRAIRIVDGQKIVTYEPVAQPAPRSGKVSSQRATRSASTLPQPMDIASAADTSRVQSTYENYRTAVMTQNESLRQSLFGVLRRDRELAMACARNQAAWAESDSERAFALKTLGELGR